jgi:hypothetical protein
MRVIYCNNNMRIIFVMPSASLSPQHGATSGCRWRRWPIRYGRWLQIYLTSSHRQPTGSDIPPCGLGKGLNPAIKVHILQNITQAFGLGQIPI